MTELVFDCVGARAERWAAGPTLTFEVRVSETAGEPVGGIALRCQLRIEPHRRHYSQSEGERLVDLFGERSRWGETMKPLQFAFVTQMVPAFAGATTFELPMPFTYDVEVASAKYFAALEEGGIPLLFLFSGTAHFPNSAWVRVRRDTFDALCRYRSERALPTWDDAFDAMLVPYVRSSTDDTSQELST